MGSVVSAYDVRTAVKDQIVSVGAKFITLDVEATAAEDKGGYAKVMDEAFYRRQRELMLEVVREQDVVITTAAVPGKKAPLIITNWRYTNKICSRDIFKGYMQKKRAATLK